MVFSFPYVREVVDAVRTIPGRRFDWDRKEWWALQADGTAPYVKGVIERHPWLKVHPDVQAWLAEAVTGWVGKVGAGKLGGAGFALETISGELPEELAALGRRAGGRLWLPFTAEVAEALLEMKGARFDERALRCAQRLRVGLEPAPATLSLIESVGEPRLKLDVNWDPETIPAFLALPACEAHGRSLPVDPYLLEPLEHYLRTFGVEVAPNAADVLERLRAEHDSAIVDVRRSRAHDGPALEVEDALGGELRPFQRAGVAYALKARRTFLADEQGLGKTVQALAALEADGAYPAVVICPASLKLNWQRETERWLPHRSITVSGTGATRSSPTSRSSTTTSSTPTARGCRWRGRRRSCSTSRTTSRTRARKRTKAVRRLAEALPEGALRLALTGTPVMNHPDELIAAAAGARPARGVRLRRALLAPLPGRRRRGAHPLAPAPLVLRAAAEGRRAAPAPAQAPGRRPGRA